MKKFLIVLLISFVMMPLVQAKGIRSSSTTSSIKTKSSSTLSASETKKMSKKARGHKRSKADDLFNDVWSAKGHGSSAGASEIK